MFFSKARVIFFISLFISCLCTNILCCTTGISTRQEQSRPSNLYIRLSLELTTRLYESLLWPHETSSKLLKQFTESVVEEILKVFDDPNVDIKAFVTQKCSILETVANDLEGLESQGFIERIRLFVNEAVSLIENYSSMVSSPFENSPEVLAIMKLGVKAYRLGLIYTGSTSSLYIRHTILILLNSIPNQFHVRRMDTILRFYLLDATAPSLSSKLPTLDPLFKKHGIDFRVALSRYINYFNCYLSLLKELLDISDKINSIPVFFDNMKEVGDGQFSRDTKLLNDRYPLHDIVAVELRELMNDPLLTIDLPPIESIMSQTFDFYLHFIILSCFRYFTPQFIMNYKNLTPYDGTSTLSHVLTDPSIVNISCLCLNGHFNSNNVKDAKFLEVISALMIFKKQLSLFRNSDEFMKSGKENDPLVKSVFSFVKLLEAYDSILKSDLLKNGISLNEGNFTELKLLPSNIENPSILINRLFYPTIEEHVCVIFTYNLNFLDKYFIYEKKNHPPSRVFITFQSKATYFRTVFCTTILNTLTDNRFFYSGLEYIGTELVTQGFMSGYTSTELAKYFCKVNNTTIGQLVSLYYEGQFKSIEEISQVVNQIGENFGELCDYYANVSASSVILPMVSCQILSQLGSERSMHRTTKILKKIAASRIMSIQEVTGFFKNRTLAQAFASIDKARSTIHKHYLKSVANLQYLVNFVGWHQKYHSYFPQIFKESIDIEILPQITEASSKYSPDVICRSDPIWKEYISDLSDIVKQRLNSNIQIFYECISNEKNTSLFVQGGIALVEERLLNKRLNDENKRSLAFTQPHLAGISALLDLKEDEGKSDDILEESLVDYSKRTMDVLALLGTD